MWPFQRNPLPAGELSFAKRVELFWAWYSEVAQRFYRAIEQERAHDLTAELSGRVDQLGGFAWVFGPGAEGRGHSLTLSGEGDLHKQLLAVYWQARAPALPGWTFYAARQRSASDLGKFQIDEQEFDPKAFWLTPRVDPERERIDLIVWHPLFAALEENTRWMLLYLFLDEALGEVGTQNWIGHIEIHDRSLAKAIPLAELYAFAERASTEHGWKKGGPGEIWSTYQMPGENLAKSRGDIFIGSTCVMPLLREYEAADGRWENPLNGTGADYVYVQIDIGFLPKGSEADARGRIEDALVATLEPASGRLLGGAIGRRFAYIDLLLFEGDQSRQLVLEVLRRQRLPRGTSLNYFAHEKKGHRVLL
jgi:hypothetical protein